MKYADVIVPLAVEGMYTYGIKEEWRERVRPGMLVLVSFAGHKKYTALVGRVHDCKPEGYEVKWLEEIVEERICLGDEHLKFLFWVSEYYMATLGEVMKAVFPVAFRLESFTALIRTCREGDDVVLTEQEKMLLGFLRPGESVALREAEKYLKLRHGLAVVRSLLDKGYIQVKETVGETYREKTERYVVWGRKYSDEQLNRILDGLKKAPVQYRMVCRWIEWGKDEMLRGDFLQQTGKNAVALKTLCDKGILRVVERSVSRLEEGRACDHGWHPLTAEQSGALHDIKNGFAGKDCVLLQGVTSSGKTEVYIHLIKEYIERGEQVLYMLPEIALTVQIVKRLQSVFGEKVGIYHSGMSDAARAELWKKQCGPSPYPLILGVRSSVFLPFSGLGLIIVDEEHDPSYKQKEPSPRYQGRDAAIMLGKIHGARVLLGSATPSFESWQNAVSGKYGLVRLNGRYGGIQMPEVVLADVGEYRRKKLMKGSFSPLLVHEMEKVLSAGKQVILFQNRRGYSTYVQCGQCGTIPKCKYCDVSLTYYKQRNVLVCRYCGAMLPMEDVCLECGSGHYKEMTPGTEKIEEEVGRLFPDKRVARMDLDVMSSRSRYKAVIDDFAAGKTHILIGTQMVTKGLDFENVKLVGVMDADSMVNFPDFRAEERAYCMLTQVSGRSGRKGERGKVVIQAADLKNRVYRMLTEGDYETFFFQLVAERGFFLYPPCARLIQMEFRARDAVVLRHAANRVAMRLREKLGKRVCGPAVPEVGRIGGLYRLVVMLKIETGMSYSGVKSFIRKELVELRREKDFHTVRIFCDVDPY